MYAKVPDKQLIRSVDMKLAQRSGGSGCKLKASVVDGCVTLSGSWWPNIRNAPSSTRSIASVACDASSIRCK